MLEAIAFYFFCALTLAMFLVVVTTQNILYALSALAAGMMFVSAFFLFVGGRVFRGGANCGLYGGCDCTLCLCDDVF